MDYGQNNNFGNTVKFKVKADHPMEPKDILMSVHDSLVEKGYDPINQIVGYILSGDPSYITSHNSSRSLIRKLERDEIIEELIGFYIKEHSGK